MLFVFVRVRLNKTNGERICFKKLAFSGHAGEVFFPHINWARGGGGGGGGGGEGSVQYQSRKFKLRPTKYVSDLILGSFLILNVS